MRQLLLCAPKNQPIALRHRGAAALASAEASPAAGAGNPGHAFGAIQKAVAALDADAMQVSLENAVLAGNVEDMNNNASLTVARLRSVVDNLYPLASLQPLHAAPVRASKAAAGAEYLQGFAP